MNSGIQFNKERFDASDESDQESSFNYYFEATFLREKNCNLLATDGRIENGTFNRFYLLIKTIKSLFISLYLYFRGTRLCLLLILGRNYISERRING